MTYSLTNKCAKNYNNRALIVQVIAENVVTCFFLRHSVHQLYRNIQSINQSIHPSIHQNTYIVPCVANEIESEALEKLQYHHYLSTLEIILTLCAIYSIFTFYLLTNLLHVLDQNANWNND